MNDEEFLAQRFEDDRTRLRAAAFRMLGSATEADDAVQEAWLRLSRSDSDSVENLPAWVTTVVARVCLNMLRARRTHGERPLDEAGKSSTASNDPTTDPEQEAVMADSVGLALLVVLDALSPAERLAFVLHDMFDVSFGEIAPIVGRSPSAAGQLASRARRRVRGASVPEADPARQRRVVGPIPRRRNRATSRGCWRSWTPTSFCAQMRKRRRPVFPPSCAAPGPSPRLRLHPLLVPGRPR